MMIGSLLQGFANGGEGYLDDECVWGSTDCTMIVAIYIVARLFLGFGIPFAIIAASSLLGELGHPKERPVLTSLFNASWFVGSIIAAGATFGTQVSPQSHDLWH